MNTGEKTGFSGKVLLKLDSRIFKNDKGLISINLHTKTNKQLQLNQGLQEKA